MATYTGIGAAFGSFFGGSDLEEGFNRAIDELKKFQDVANKSLGGFRAKGQTAFDRGLSELSAPTLAPDVAALRQMLVTQVSSGLSPFAQLQFEDLNRELENRSSATGNLRSGAVGLQRAELGRRIVADEFGRGLQVLDTLQRRDVAASQMLLNTSLGFGEMENVALRTSGMATEHIAGAMIGRGAVQQQRAVALGEAIGGLADKGEEYAKMYFTGGASSIMGGGGGGGA